MKEVSGAASSMSRSRPYSRVSFRSLLTIAWHRMRLVDMYLERIYGVIPLDGEYTGLVKDTAVEEQELFDKVQ